MKRVETIDLVSAAGVAAILAAAGAVWRWAPAEGVPLHLGLNGHVDRWGSSAEAAGGLLLLSAVTAGVAGYGAWARRSPRTTALASRPGFLTGRVVGLIAPLVAAALLTAMALGGTGPADDPERLLRIAAIGVSAVLLVAGVALGRVSPNAFVGVRTYWSLTSRRAWDRSNRLAGRLFAGIGLIGVVAALLAPPAAVLTNIMVATLAAAVWSAVESWRVWRLDPDRAPA